MMQGGVKNTTEQIQKFMCMWRFEGRQMQHNSCKSMEYVMTVAGTRGLPDREKLNQVITSDHSQIKI